jgi:internalin A
MLGENQLSHLPEEIERLTNLRVLILDKNKFDLIPVEVAQLHQLKTLRFYDNSLEAVPDEIGQLTNLQSLYLSSNPVEHPARGDHPTDEPAIPRPQRQPVEYPARGDHPTDQARKARSARQPHPYSPRNFGAKRELGRAPGDLTEILNFYFQALDPDESEPLYEAKFLIIGEGGAGKTTLAKKIDNIEYELQPDEKPPPKAST